MVSRAWGGGGVSEPRPPAPPLNSALPALLLSWHNGGITRGCALLALPSRLHVCRAGAPSACPGPG